MKKGIKIAIGICAAAALITGCVAAFLLMDKKKPVEEEETRPTVEYETPKLGDIVLYSDIIGTIEPTQETNVIPKISGDVLTVNFQVGDYVTAGQELITIQSDTLKSLQLQVDSAKIAKDDAATNLSRTQALFDTGAVSQQQLEQARSQASTTKIAYENAKTQLDLQSGYTTVTSPIDGVIETKSIEVHDMAAPSSPICTISGAQGISASFGVPENILNNLNIGDIVNITKASNTYKGSITEISTKVSPATGLYQIKAALDDTENLYNGSKVEISLISSEARQALLIPVEAVSYSNGEPFVYVYDKESHSAKRTDIKAGIFDENNFEVTSGLNLQSEVIVTWSNELYDGANVIAKEVQISEESESSAESEPGTESESSAESESGTEIESGAESEAAATE